MADEDIVVFRLEGVGSFAVPVPVLDDYAVPSTPAHAAAAVGADCAGALGFEPVPIILSDDFLRGRTARRRELVIDRYGCVGLPDRAAPFEVSEGSAGSG